MTIRSVATRRKEEIGERVSYEVDGVRFEEASPAEWQAMLEEMARRDLGMSLAHFDRAYWAGELDPCDERVADLAILLPT